MAEELKIAEGGKEARYALLYEQIKSLLAGETDPVARMANVAAMIHFTFHFFWTGFYRVVGDELVLGPFQGPWPVCALATGVASAVRPGRRLIRSWCPMWSSSPATSPAVRSRVAKL